MTTNLFLDGVYNSNSTSPSTVFISMPNSSGKSFIVGGNVLLLKGLMIGDPTWTAANSWGPVISDIANLRDAASLIGSSSQFSWINASTMCWKGTSPLQISIDFYLINYKRGLGHEDGLCTLARLAAIDKGSAGIAQEFTVHVHGGYASDILTGNKSFYTEGIDFKSLNKGSAVSDQGLGGAIGDLYSNGYAVGSVQLQFGNKSIIRNLLLSKLSVTESITEVADQDGSNPKPLYYRVSASFTGVRPLVVTDISEMLGVSSSGSNSAPTENNGDVVEGAFIPSGYRL